MLFKLKQTFFLILCLISLNCCNTRWTADTFVKTRQNKEQLKREKEIKQRKKENQKSIEKIRKENYDKQPLSTRKTWDENEKRAKRWNKKKFHNHTIVYKIRKFFERFGREPKPEDGLMSGKQKRKRKGNIFRKLFKKK